MGREPFRSSDILLVGANVCQQIAKERAFIGQVVVRNNRLKVVCDELSLEFWRRVHGNPVQGTVPSGD